MSDALVRELERARALGFLGPGAVEEHIEHSAGFLLALTEVTGRIIDLGSGGGIPGLVLATTRADVEVVLVDAMAKRCGFLEGAIQALALRNTRVVHGRAEMVARGELRGTADAVVARGFGPPAVTAECSAPLLRLEGRLVVSEPPDGVGRWPSEGLAQLGLRLGPRSLSSPVMQTLIQTELCAERYPRRNGMPAKRPLF